MEGCNGPEAPKISLRFIKRKITNLKHINVEEGQPKSSKIVKVVFNENQDSTQPAEWEQTCQECKEHFNTKYEADIHRQQVHFGVATWKKEYNCDTCNEIFTQKISLNVHRMFKHGAPRRYQCDKCDYEGPRLYHLKRHMKVHTDERLYVCSVCHKGFKTNQAYRNHMVLHTNDGRFACNICNKTFNQKSLFEDHQRSHQQERNYSCSYCDATFKTHKHIACHIRAVHLKDKRFICDLCGAKHMTGANLKTHMKIHRDIATLPYAFHCNGCDAKFRGFDGLSVHMRVIHAMNLTNEKVHEVSGTNLLTPHPTRRPLKLEYVLISRDEEGDDPGMLEVSAEGNDDTVCVEGENFTVCELKTEETVSMEDKITVCEAKTEDMDCEVQHNKE